MTEKKATLESDVTNARETIANMEKRISEAEDMKLTLKKQLGEAKADLAAIRSGHLEKEVEWESKLKAAEKSVSDAGAEDAARSSEMEQLQKSLQEANDAMKWAQGENEAYRKKLEVLAKEHEDALAEAALASETASSITIAKEECESRIKEMEASYLQQRIDEETKWKARSQRISSSKQQLEKRE